MKPAKTSVLLLLLVAVCTCGSDTPRKVGQETALQLKTIQVDILNANLRLQQLEAQFNATRDHRQALQVRLNAVMDSLFKAAKLDPKKWVLDETKWEIVQKPK